MSARVVQRHVLDEIDDPRLRVYVVWGPMLEKETESDAREATGFVPDARATHFWTPLHTLAEMLAPAAGLPAGERAWDTYQLFAAGVRWGDAPPTPNFLMHVGKPLPDSLRLNGDELRRQTERLLATR
jgi:hypothetical protein